jgi:hypothetical protein
MLSSRNRQSRRSRAGVTKHIVWEGGSLPGERCGIGHKVRARVIGAFGMFGDVPSSPQRLWSMSRAGSHLSRRQRGPGKTNRAAASLAPSGLRASSLQRPEEL